MIECNKIYNMTEFELLSLIDDDSVDLVIADPDYNVGIKYNNKSYKVKFNKYIDNYVAFAKEIYRVLKPTGNAIFINYDKNNSYLRVRYLDDAFFEVFNYVWVYNTNTGFSPNRFTTAHRSVIHARKSKKSLFDKNAVAEKYKNPTDKRVKQLIEHGSKGRAPYSWFYFNQVKNVTKSKSGVDYHPCILPDGLTSLFIKAMSHEDDLVFIPYGGSGSEIKTCKKLNRNFLASEIDPVYCKRLEENL